MAQRYARTVIGWTGSGETVIMIVDGTDDKSGATGYQLDRLLQSLHVVTALDLDGGDSTALYANGRIIITPVGLRDRSRLVFSSSRIHRNRYRCGLLSREAPTQRKEMTGVLGTHAAE